MLCHGKLYVLQGNKLISKFKFSLDETTVIQKVRNVKKKTFKNECIWHIIIINSFYIGKQVWYVIVCFVLLNTGLCSDGWVSYMNTCYLIVNVYGTWELSKSLCQDHGAHLMVVNSEEELDFLSSIVKLSESYWIGLVEKKEGQWSWVDGTDYSTTEHHWDVGQPDDWDVRVNGEDCGQLHARITVDRRRLWNDADCTLSFPYICEGKPKSH
uniref:Asialoglycoprotein receptor-like 1 n=1 Tax=Sinocyclocheilus rhinocerous TaxID=307959 RepID=A0A673GBG7_9TELE